MSKKTQTSVEEKQPRMIVRRPKQAVGGRREPSSAANHRAIVRRKAGAGVRSPEPPRGRSLLGWRPGGRFAVALFALAGFAAAGGIGAWAWYSPYFEIERVQVSGTQRIPPEIVLEIAGLSGESMFTADLNAAQRAIYEIPMVSSARIERVWPDGIEITIREREAWGIWEQGGVAYTIDRQGMVLGPVPAPEGAPVIVSSEPGSRQQGEHVDYQAVEAAAAIYELLPGALGTPVAEVAYVAGKGLVVTTANGQTALFGDSSSIAYKLAVWAALADEAQARRIPYTTIDLRYGNRPVLQ